MQSKEIDGELPGSGLEVERMPGHWVLARLGKRTLRPGGMELTRRMLAQLDIGEQDAVVEFAPGLGATAALALQRRPVSYTGVERDERAAQQVRRRLAGPGRQCLVGRAERSGLPDGAATVVYGEAMLTMQPASGKAAIAGEAARLLQPGGRYGIHELCLRPDDLPETQKDEIQQALSAVIRVGARPLTAGEWEALLEAQGFRVADRGQAPMHLLEPRRLLRDERLGGALRFAWNVARQPAARRRIRAMRAVFRKYAPHLGALTLVAVKE